ncbi:MAG TPA: sigma-70 family RNA polymerase sigma factor [Saprospiraceae bacterium]|nr:sigma-70 family RNA polymerase sigma factor [Saprospiraceae bacterium]
MDEIIHWQRLREGDMQGLQALYDMHVDSLYAYGMAMCQDTDRVKDCIQELFLAFWNNHQNLNIPRSGKAYLMVSLRRRIFDPGPKSLLQTSQLDHTEIDRMTATEDFETGWIQGEAETERLKQLEKAMSRISERQREIIHMKYYQKMDYDEIGQIMGLNYQSARNLVTRALVALRREMTLIT